MPRRTAVDPISALRHSGFLVYLIGGLISNTGSQMRIVAVQWEITIREPDPRKLALGLGYIGLALVLPVILFALPAGAAADRFSRRWLIVIAQLGLAVCGVGLAWASWVQGAAAVHLFAAVRNGRFPRLGWPASSAIVTGLVPPRVFSNAATWRSNAYQLASTIGPLAGGFLLAWWNPVHRVPDRCRVERGPGDLHVVRQADAAGASDRTEIVAQRCCKEFIFCAASRSFCRR